MTTAIGPLGQVGGSAVLEHEERRGAHDAQERADQDRPDRHGRQLVGDLARFPSSSVVRGRNLV